VCGGCDLLALPMERQESWRCGDCGHFNRSWWRTPSAKRDALAVVTRRRHAAVEAERAKVRAGMRRRRWKIIAGAIAGLIAALAFVVVVKAAEPTAATDTTTTCSHFERLRGQLAGNTLGLSAIKDEVEQLKSESVSADPAVQKGVVDLASAGRPGTASFLVAETALADACEAAAD
jgi:hypothetical protein